MSSKQEKLAAARKKLKEFQGKNKEAEISKQKTTSDALSSKSAQDAFFISNSVIHNSPFVSKNVSLNSTPLGIQTYQKFQSPVNSKEKIIELLSNENTTSETNLPDFHISNQNLMAFNSGILQKSGGFESSITDCTNGSKVECGESQNNDSQNNCDTKTCSNSILREDMLMMAESNFNISKKLYTENNKPEFKSFEPEKFFDNDISKNASQELIISMQEELQSHVQTITILVQQRNEAQAALSEIQNLLNKKSGETEELKQQVAHLTSSVNNLTQRLSEAENDVKKINLENEKNFQQWNEARLLGDCLKTQLDGKEEEFLEMKRKYEEKNNDCQQLLFSLQEAQNQLSFYQIQLQQYSNEGHSNLAIQVSELQNENLSLKKKVLELEEKLEVELAEKDESSQKFHVYAQQCNTQLSSLNSQLNTLKTQNQNLVEENDNLSKKLIDLKNVKEEISKPYETEVADLHDQLSALTENYNELTSKLEKREEECSQLNDKLSEKESELKKISKLFKELEEENTKLLAEAETPKANERLLATMESDKIAAAKAVSQNMKLKEQVIELEKAFIKVSEEKLILTDQLSHEKHVSKELQNLLKNLKSENHECHHEETNERPLINDSNEIEELRTIIRQLQDDKMELTARLNSYESKKNNYNEDSKHEKEHCDHDHEENETNCENTKLLLQQMKEKVKKTMNEIAVLDEEKEKLEHLVLQLQGETETIGEYITLYQKQRMLLRQRAQEKDNQLLQLSRDKEELKAKLSALDELVQRLLLEKENVKFEKSSTLKSEDSIGEISENTAGKIRALINEIGSTTLINNQSIAFEHCSCCSGRLITI